MWGTLHCKYKNNRDDNLTKDTFHYNVLKNHLQDIKLQYTTPASSSCTWLYIVKSGFD